MAEEIGKGLLHPELSLDGVTDFELIELSELLRNGVPHSPRLAFSDQATGAVVVIAEAEFINALAALTSEQLPAIASRWARAEGWRDESRRASHAHAVTCSGTGRWTQGVTPNVLG
jgi:hypothetical protein